MFVQSHAVKVWYSWNKHHRSSGGGIMGFIVPFLDVPAVKQLKNTRNALIPLFPPYKSINKKKVK